MRGDATIRRASARDAGALAAFAERTFREAFSALNTPENMDLHCARSYGEALQARELADTAMETYVAEVTGEANGELVAYAQLRWGHAPPSVRAAKPVEILRFYVDPERHGKGLAQALMALLVDRARSAGADVVWLGVWENNPRAIAFYAKAGFAEAGEHVFALGHDLQRDLVLTLPSPETR